MANNPYSENYDQQEITLSNDVFPPNKVAVVDGGAKVAAHFSSLNFDHLIFTGSTAAGRKVMTAATKNLTMFSSMFYL